MTIVAVPYHERKRYALNHVFDWVDQAELPDSEILLRWHRGTFGEQGAVKKQREFFRKLAVERNADHLLYIGADTIPPLDALPRLLAHDKDVVGGVYYNRKGVHNGQKRAIAWCNGTNEQSFLSDGLAQVDGMGMDCVLFSCKAFTSFSWDDYGVSDDDYPVYDILKAKGFDIWLDTSLTCKHYETTDKYI